MAKNQNNQQNKPEDKKDGDKTEQKQELQTGGNGTETGNSQAADPTKSAVTDPVKDPVEPVAEKQPAQVLLVGGWELAFRFSELLTEAGVDVTVVDNALKEAKDAGDLPESLADVVIPHVSLQRYAAEIAVAGYDPELVSFVVADPAVDPTLRSLNFMRRMQGLGMTHFYPRFHDAIEDDQQ